MTDTNKIVAGVFVALTLLLSGAYMTADMNKTYSCSATGLVGMCDKLTTNNTRCYFSVDNKTTYKGCNTGWTKVTTPQQIVDTLCMEKNGYKYCCESKQLDSGSCDFIIRK